MDCGPDKVGGAVGRDPGMVGGAEEDVTEGNRDGGLVRATAGNCSCTDDESVEDGTARSESNDNACDCHVNLPKVEGKSETEQ